MQGWIVVRARITWIDWGKKKDDGGGEDVLQSFVFGCIRIE